MFNINNLLDSLKSKHANMVESTNSVVDTINNICGLAILPENIYLKAGKVVIKNISAVEKSIIFTKKQSLIDAIKEKVKLNITDVVL